MEYLHFFSIITTTTKQISPTKLRYCKWTQSKPCAMEWLSAIFCTDTFLRFTHSNPLTGNADHVLHPDEFSHVRWTLAIKVKISEWYKLEHISGEVVHLPHRLTWINTREITIWKRADAWCPTVWSFHSETSYILRFLRIQVDQASVFPSNL